MKALILTAIALALFGCATTNGKIVKFDEAKLEALSDKELAYKYHQYRFPNGLSKLRTDESGFAQLETQLKKRGLTDDEIESAREGKVFIGMSQLGMHAAYGKPSQTNNTVLASGTRRQHVYFVSRAKSAYVYTVNGIVTAIQN